MRVVRSLSFWTGPWKGLGFDNLRTAALALLVLSAPVDRCSADATYQPLPFSQNWSATGLISTNDNWSQVPGIVGYRGDHLATVTGTDPQTVLQDDTSPVIDVNANQTNPLIFNMGGTTEFELADPVVALIGSSSAYAPYLVFHIDATGFGSIVVSYRLRDLEGAGGTDNSLQQVALHFRTTGTAAWTNLPAGYVADATSGPGMTEENLVSVTLPAAANNVATLEIRVMTTNAIGNDEAVGVDDIQVTGVGAAIHALNTGVLEDTNDGRGVAWGDYDGDGDHDLYLANNNANAKLFRNDAGTWVDVSVSPVDLFGGRGVAWADYDDDGDLDLFVNGASGGSTRRLFRNDGGNTWVNVASGALVSEPGNVVAWADYDLDGDLDLFLGNQDLPSRLFRNDAGTFVQHSVPALGGAGDCGGAAWGDYDNDGDPDLWVASMSKSSLIRNDGGTFVDVTVSQIASITDGRGIAWGDYDNDGDLDVFVARFQRDKLMRNHNGAFMDVTPSPIDDNASQSFGAAWADYDNDGDLDLFVANRGTTSKLFRNDGNNTWVGTNIAMTDGRGAAWGDYDADGDLDLYVSSDLGSANRFFVNSNLTGNHWLQLRLVGTATNRSAIGARVRIVVGGVSQIREVSGGDGYSSQNSLDVEFGLGSATTVDSITIRWPSGMVWDTTAVALRQTLGVGVDRLIEVVEGAALLGVDGAASRPAALELAAVPNPFRHRTRIDYVMPAAGRVRLTVLDLMGRVVAPLADRELAAGRYSATWDGRWADHGEAVAGVYFARLVTRGDAGERAAVRRMVLTR